MNNKDYFKDIYTDFFGIESNPKIEVKDTEKKNSNEFMSNAFDKINDLYITNKSKEQLKKLIEYIRKYTEKIETNYVPFNLILNVNNKDTSNTIIELLYEGIKVFNYLDNPKQTNISLYDIPKDLKLNSNEFISISDLKGFDLLDNNDKEKLIFKLESSLKEDKSIIIISGTSNEIANFFLGRENIKNKYFNIIIDSINPDKQDIYNIVLDKVKLNDNDKIKLLDYITNTYNEEIDYIDYQKRLIDYISFNKEIPPIKEEKTIDEVFKSLNELVGLKKVKKVLYELVDVIELKNKAKEDLNIKDINLHMVFLGNPGTGKTTIARIIAEILYNLGYVKENKLIEVSSKDLVAEYVGQTAPKTMSVIEKSLNGVLFIDEAYSLAVKGDNSYNAECIATLIQAMENYRDKLVVIFAGYTKEMQDFLNSNSGIVSRIGYTLEFEDYTTEELMKIFSNLMTKSGFKVKEDAMEYLKEIIEDNRNVKNFGNARFIRNIYEKTIIKHASNTKNKKRKDILKTITKEDISIENLKL